MSEVITTRISRRTHTLAKKIARDQGLKLFEVFDLAVNEMRKDLFYEDFNKSNQRLKEVREAAKAEEEIIQDQKRRKSLGIKVGIKE
ncbi:MAG: hypothetical protein WD266_13590 [Balneolales bacterium]